MESPSLPVLSIMAASICVIGVALFIFQFYLGIGECLRLLQTIFEIGIEDLSFIQNYRINYLTLAVLTLVLAILVVSTDFLRSDARNSPYPICMFCMGSAPSLVLTVLLYNVMLLWCYVFFKVCQVNFLYFNFYNECHTDNTKAKFTNANGCINLEWYNYWFPANAKMNICGEFLKEFCNEFVIKSKSYFTLSWIAVVIIIMGVGFCLMSMSSMLSEKEEKIAKNEIRSSESSIDRSRSRSQSRSRSRYD